MKKLVIFDLDGTLLNTYADIAAATNHALSLHGFPTHDVPTIRSFVGNGINKLFERALPEGHKTQEDVLAIRADFIPYYNAHGTEKTFVFDGMTELLERLSADGCKVAVASNKYQEATRHLIPFFFPTIAFSAIFGQRDGVPTKPDPKIIDDIMVESGVIDKKEVLYVGDSEVDMQTARNARVECIGVTWGCKTRQLLENHNPLAVIDKPSEIFDIYEAKKTDNYFVHESSYVDDDVLIGEGTKVWHFCHIQSGARIGRNCSFGQNVNVGNDVKIGNGVRVQNNVSLYTGVELEDNVFCGPSCVFTNVNTPRANFPVHGVYAKTVIHEGASLGANCTIVCGHSVGRSALIAAGAVVTKDVPDFALMAGVPAKRIGWVCECGKRLDDTLVCQCGRRYREDHSCPDSTKLIISS